jgi:hypothetical protein
MECLEAKTELLKLWDSQKALNNFQHFLKIIINISHFVVSKKLISTFEKN